MIFADTASISASVSVVSTGCKRALISLYWFLLSAGELAAGAGYVPPIVGLWACNAAVGVIAILLIRRLRTVEV